MVLNTETLGYQIFAMSTRDTVLRNCSSFKFLKFTLESLQDKVIRY
jgi:hypothetical protein